MLPKNAIIGVFFIIGGYEVFHTVIRPHIINSWLIWPISIVWSILIVLYGIDLLDPKFLLPFRKNMREEDE